MDGQRGEDGLGWTNGRRTAAFGHPARMNYYKRGTSTTTVNHLIIARN